MGNHFEGSPYDPFPILVDTTGSLPPPPPPVDPYRTSTREFMSRESPSLRDIIRRAPSGAVRDGREGKGRYDLLMLGFARALKQIAYHCEKGAGKYSDRNWERGQPMSWYLDSGLRHIAGWASGQADEDHLRAAAWNLLAALETRERVDVGLLGRELLDLDLKESSSGISSD